MSETYLTLPERRRHPRAQLRIRLQGIRLDADGPDVQETLEMLDLSRSGLGAKTDSRLYPGQRIVLCLPMHPHGGRRTLYASVVRCHRMQDGYRVGLEFDQVALASAGLPSMAAAAAA